MTTVLLIMGVVFALGMVYSVYMNKRQKGRLETFMAQHPDAARLRLVTVTSNMIQRVQVDLTAVGDEEPIFTNEGTTKVVMLAPGRHEIHMYASYNMIKGNKETGVTSMWIEVVAGGVYELTYDVNEETFRFKQVG